MEEIEHNFDSLERDIMRDLGYFPPVASILLLDI